MEAPSSNSFSSGESLSFSIDSIKWFKGSPNLLSYRFFLNEGFLSSEFLSSSDSLPVPVRWLIGTSPTQRDVIINIYHKITRSQPKYSVHPIFVDLNQV